jgi:hypothetical protein
VARSWHALDTCAIADAVAATNAVPFDVAHACPAKAGRRCDAASR